MVQIGSANPTVAQSGSEKAGWYHKEARTACNLIPMARPTEYVIEPTPAAPTGL